MVVHLRSEDLELSDELKADIETVHKTHDVRLPLTTIAIVEPNPVSQKINDLRHLHAKFGKFPSPLPRCT